jgi:hypothetical protein
MKTITLVRPDRQADAPAAIRPAPRVPLPDGATVTIVDNGKPKARDLMRFIVEELRRELPIGDVRVVSKPAATATLDADQAREIAGSSQLVLAGLGDCGACSACSLHDVAQLESLGVPSVLIHTDPFQGLVAEFGASLGLPAPPAVSVPHPISSRDEDYLRRVAATAADGVRAAVSPPAAASRTPRPAAARSAARDRQPA